MCQSLEEAAAERSNSSSEGAAMKRHNDESGQTREETVSRYYENGRDEQLDARTS